MSHARGVDLDQSPRTGTAFWIGWILLTTIGYATGLGLDSVLYSGTGPALSGVAAGVASTALYGAVVGGDIRQQRAVHARHDRSQQRLAASGGRNTPCALARDRIRRSTAGDLESAQRCR